MYSVDELKTAHTMAEKIAMVLRMENDDVVEAVQEGWIFCHGFRLDEMIPLPSGKMKVTFADGDVIITESKDKLAAMLRGILTEILPIEKQKEFEK